MAKSSKEIKTNDNTSRAYEKAVIQDMEDSKIRVKPWVLQFFGLAFILIGLLFIVYPFFSTGNNFNLPEFQNLSKLIADFRNSDEVEQENIQDEEKKNEENDGVGRIAEGAATTRDNASTGRSKAKSVENSVKIQRTGVWQATDYKKGDIQKGEYKVKLGDTLWEVSEAVYGQGDLWNNILQENLNDIDFLQDGSQALIVTGQILVIP